MLAVQIASFPVGAADGYARIGRCKRAAGRRRRRRMVGADDDEERTEAGENRAGEERSRAYFLSYTVYDQDQILIAAVRTGEFLSESTTNRGEQRT